MKTHTESAADQAIRFQTAALRVAALNVDPVSGWTHNFYRYPARFSPHFARVAIEQFSNEGALVADPYMGGGTSLVEAIAVGRDVIGNDLNSLASFVARVKTTPLSEAEMRAVAAWARDVVPGFGYHARAVVEDFVDPATTRNLTVVRARFIKKILAQAIASIRSLPTEASQAFVRCAMLATGQWALDGRSRHTSVTEFRERLQVNVQGMLPAMEVFANRAAVTRSRVDILNLDAAFMDRAPELGKRRVDLVITSPPYPGVHVLYHRWQVNGRRETPAPYWITGCSDGQGAAFYNFGHRSRRSGDDYFESSLRTLLAIRRIMRPSAYMIQMIAFNRPDEQLARYLRNMEIAGFTEVSSANRIWRQVPNRKWHANLRGQTFSSEEVVLVHRAT